MRLGEYLSETGPQPRGRAGGRGAGGQGKSGGAAQEAAAGEQTGTWELTPGSYDGIYQQILLPEMRLLKDTRVVDYWDYRLKREADIASRSKLTFEIDKFNQVRRPQILWSRAVDLARVGQKNRAIDTMFKQIKEYPTHPDASTWITELEGLLAPPAPVAAPAASSEVTSATTVPVPVSR
jgi:hypothetical protein